MQSLRIAFLVTLALAGTGAAEVPEAPGEPAPRPRARDAGLVVGTFPTGPLNAITDVAGVRVGHATVIRGDAIRTGVTAIIPAPGNLYTHPVPAWIHVGNGYGKLIGETQVREFGELETPVLLTCTLCVWSAANALKEWTYEQPGMGEHTLNPVVGETNDARVNDMWADPVGRQEVYAALAAAGTGPVAEGSVGAGTGTQAFGWKGGIGTSSRLLPAALGGYTLGVLVQTNFGGTLTVNGAPVGRELGRYAYRRELELARPSHQLSTAPTHALESAGLPSVGHPRRTSSTPVVPSVGKSHISRHLRRLATRAGEKVGLEAGAGAGDREDGSIMIVVATDAPLAARGLARLASRAMLGLARTGSFAHNGSGDYVIAFSTDPRVRRPRQSAEPFHAPALTNEAMSPLFAAAVEATEEAIYNAIFKATTVTSARGTLEAIPLAPLLGVLERYRVLGWDKRLPPAVTP